MTTCDDMTCGFYVSYPIRNALYVVFHFGDLCVQSITLLEKGIIN